jgi:DNA integrity scanning protein DisA with diadenylate cyclase activity
MANNKVYLLFHEVKHEFDELISVYSSEEQAKEALEKYKKFLDSQNMNSSYRNAVWLREDSLTFGRYDHVVYIRTEELDPSSDF